MNAKEVITTVMKQSGLNQTQMASMIGLNNQSGFSMALSRADLKVGFFVKVLNAMGYEVIVKKRERGRKESGAIVVTADFSGKDKEMAPDNTGVVLKFD